MTFSERKASFGLAKILFFQRTYLDANIASLNMKTIFILPFLLILPPHKRAAENTQYK